MPRLYKYGHFFEVETVELIKRHHSATQCVNDGADLLVEGDELFDLDAMRHAIAQRDEMARELACRGYSVSYEPVSGRDHHLAAIVRNV